MKNPEQEIIVKGNPPQAQIFPKKSFSSGFASPQLTFHPQEYEIDISQQQTHYPNTQQTICHTIPMPYFIDLVLFFL